LDPDSYVQSQALAERLLGAGSLGIVYPSVRRPRGTCLACFRPALVVNVRKGTTYRFRWSGDRIPTIDPVKPA
jgi:RES domain